MKPSVEASFRRRITLKLSDHEMLPKVRIMRTSIKYPRVAGAARVHFCSQRHTNLAHWIAARSTPTHLEQWPLNVLRAKLRAYQGLGWGCFCFARDATFDGQRKHADNIPDSLCLLPWVWEIAVNNQGVARISPDSFRQNFV